MQPSTQRQRQLTVTRAVVIDRPVAKVAAQFADVGHHERTGVHRTATFHVIAEADDWCDYDHVSRVGAPHHQAAIPARPH